MGVCQWNSSELNIQLKEVEIEKTDTSGKVLNQILYNLYLCYTRISLWVFFCNLHFALDC